MRTILCASVLTFLVGCGGDGTPAPQTGPSGEVDVSGSYKGTFTTDNVLFPMGTMAMTLTEDQTTHKVTGSFSGDVAGQKLAGTLTGVRSGSKLSIDVSVTLPIAAMLALRDATVSGNTISGPFSITMPVMATGSFTMTKQ